MTLYIKNATFIDWQSLRFTKTDMAVESGPYGGIRLIPSIDALAPKNLSNILDAKGRFVTKSFGCGHHHIYSTLARGMPAPAKTPRNFVDILSYIWWNLDKNLDLEMIKASALASALFCAKNGVTFVIDHHSSPFAVEDSLFVIKEAFDTIGISHLLCYEMSDRDGEKVRDAGLDETKNFLKAGNQGHVSLHASFTVGNDLLEKAIALAKKFTTGIHIHVAEDMADQEHCLKHHGKRVMQRLFDAGALDLPGSILGHCIHLDNNEKSLLRDSKAWVVQNTESNLNNNVGLGNYSACGSNIMLGTDGMHSDMLRSAKAAFFVGQGTEGIGFPEIYKRFRNIHRYIKKGHYKGDADNNLVILDYNTPTHMNQDNFSGHFLFGIESSHVDSVISSGRLIVKNKKLITASEQDILQSAKEMGNRLWKKLS
ncbi:MAG: amidohydrolase family protein [Desulfobacula sp.]|uniref:amidohydrolase family protein n=1 Tax=Desulfobacula sp. TaxID=2593537 RepID=UPI0025C38E26|nr:amidohydrolase family protein [Desulfobacula sp.]MCD4719676.1 amidohydrolase family protein [Desulfobacula sp.]